MTTEPSMRARAEAEIRATLNIAEASAGYDSGDVRACLDRILDILMEPTQAVYEKAGEAIPMTMTGHGIVARTTALEVVRAHLGAVKANL